MDDDEIDKLMHSLQVMKIRKAGKYSNRKQQSNNCSRCLTEHTPGRCPAYGQECHNCKGRNHYARACSKKTTRDIKRVTGDKSSYLETRTSSNDQIQKETITISKVTDNDNDNLRVPIKIGDTTVTVFIDSGCDFTIIPPESYKEDMEEIVEEDIAYVHNRTAS